MGVLRSTLVRVTAKPRLIATGAEETLRLAGGGTTTPYRFGGFDYKAGLGSLPRFRAELGFDEKGWTGGVAPTTGVFDWAPTRPDDYKNYPTLYHWKDAAITVEVALERDDRAEPASWTTVLVGSVAGVTADQGILRFTVADLSAQLDKPIAAAKFSGAGGIEGPPEAKERIKRRNFGTVYNVECRILNVANSIWEFGHPSFQSTSVLAVRDIGATASPAPTVVAWQGSVDATLNALIAATPAQGSAVVAPSIQCLKWWTTPVGPLTVDVVGEGGDLSAPALATQLIDLFGGGVTYDTSERTFAISLRPDSAGLHISDDRETIAQALDRLLLGVSLAWVLDATGKITFRPFSLANPVETITSLEVSRERVFPPTKKRKLGYKRNNREHNDGEIASSVTAAEVAGLGDLATLDSVAFGSPQATGFGSLAGKNAVVTYSASAPASPAEGDLWVDTSATPNIIRVRVAGVWQVGANYTTNTDQLADGAQLGLSAVWSGVSGAGKPADDATKNIVTYAASAPSSPVNGDFWIDTSATPYVAKIRVGGVWQLAANLTTNTNQLTDGANLGKTAEWPTVTGTGKPSDYADVTSDKAAIGDGNRVRFSMFEAGLLGWGTYNPNGLAGSEEIAAQSDGRNYLVGNRTFTANGQSFSIGSQLGPNFRFTVNGGERLAVQARIGIDVGGNSARSWQFVVWWFDSTGASISNTQIAGTTGGVTIGTLVSNFATAPSNARFGYVELYLHNNSAGEGYATGFLANVMVSSAGAAQTIIPPFLPGPSAELAADVSAVISGVFPIVINFESDGTTAKPGQLPRTTNNQLLRNGVNVSEEATWSVAVLSGTVGAAVSNTASTRGRLTISSLGTAEAVVRLTAVHNGLIRRFDITVQKDIAATSSSGSGGGSGGGSNAVDNALAEVLSSSSSAGPNVVSDELTVTLGSAVTQARLILYADIVPGVTTANNSQWSYKAQWWNGSAWVDVNGYVASSAYVYQYDAESGWTREVPATASFNILHTGLSGGSTNKYRLVGYPSLGGQTGYHVDGSFQAKGDGT